MFLHDNYQVLSRYLTKRVATTIVKKNYYASEEKKTTAPCKLNQQNGFNCNSFSFFTPNLLKKMFLS